jgi:thioredoxin 1
MTFKPLGIVLFLSGLAFGQFPPPAMEGNATFDSSEIIVDQLLKSKVPVLIDFWATWCMPCRMLSPTLEEIRKKYAGRIKVMKVNVDVNMKVSAYFHVSAIPAVFFVKDKAVVLYLQGLRPKQDYEAAIQQVLSMKPAQSDTAAQKKRQEPSPSSVGTVNDSSDHRKGAKAAKQD